MFLVHIILRISLCMPWLRHLICLSPLFFKVNVGSCRPRKQFLLNKMQNWYVNRWNRRQLNLPCEHQWHTFDDRVWKKHILSIKAACQEVWIVVWLIGNTCYVSKKNKWSFAWHKWRNHNTVTVKVGKKVFQWQEKKMGNDV